MGVWNVVKLSAQFAVHGCLPAFSAETMSFILCATPPLPWIHLALAWHCCPTSSHAEMKAVPLGFVFFLTSEALKQNEDPWFDSNAALAS